MLTISAGSVPPARKQLKKRVKKVNFLAKKRGDEDKKEKKEGEK